MIVTLISVYLLSVSLSHYLLNKSIKELRKENLLDETIMNASVVGNIISYIPILNTFLILRIFFIDLKYYFARFMLELKHFLFKTKIKCKCMFYLFKYKYLSKRK